MNRGAEETRAEVIRRGLSQNAAAALVGADSGHFSRILRGEAKPGRALAGRIKEKFGTELSRWDESVFAKGAA